MKKNLFLAGFALALCALMSFQTNSTAKTKVAKINLSWSFANITEGYDHDNKCKVYVDGKEIGESSVTKESVPNTYSVTTTAGNHKIKVMNLALYDGTWIEHTVANEFSIDCFWESTVNIKKKININLLFDINTGTIPKIKK